jgi:signal transduction histidine kinase
VIRTRWLVLFTIAVVVASGVLVYLSETDRSEAALDDLGAEQRAVARAASLALAGGASLASVERDGAVVLIADAGTLRGLDGHPVTAPDLAAAIARGESTVRVSPADAPALGLPARTAMVGVARVADRRSVAVASSAERQRDRDRSGRLRVLLTMLLAAVVMTGSSAVIWKKQQSEAELARELAVAETARGRDAELDRLSRAATMAALGSGVAHELSTPLGVIVGRAEQLLARAGGDERTARSAQAILDQADHINRVVRGLLGLARGAPIAMQPTAAAELVGAATARVEHRFQRAGVRLDADVDPALPDVRCEPLLLEHALINLLLNACDASPAGAVVRVAVHAGASEITFAVTDDGAGITPDDAARALEPFFTTKPPGAGTGLGLAIASEIAKTHRGALEIAPRSPRGTRACIRVPIEGDVS